MQGVIKSYDPGTGDGVILCDTDFRRVRPGRRRARRLALPHAPAGPAGHLRPRRRRARHRPPARLRGRHGHARVSDRPARRSHRADDDVGGGQPRDQRPTTQPEAPRLGRGVAGGLRARRRPLVRRLRRGVRPRCASCSSTAARSSGSSDAKRPNSYLALSDPGDVARVEDRTFICSRAGDRRRPDQQLAGPGRDEGRRCSSLYRGAMRGRTMYVVPFSMGPLGSPIAHIGVQLTDSPYVAVNMRIMTRMGQGALDVLGRRRVRALPALGRLPARRRRRQRPADVPWPCDAENKYIVHFPETREIWSYGSGYGGNALLGKKCFALRIASTMARDDGWMAEHMLDPRRHAPRTARSATSPPRSRRPAARRTWRCSSRPCPGWKVETVGDDIAWMKFGDDGRLYAINPEAGFFGVAPGTCETDQPQRHAHARRQLHLHQRRQDRRRRRLVGGPDRRAAGAPRRLEGQRLDAGVRARRPPTPTPASPRRPSQCPSIAPEWEDPAGVPISAILFGGRRATNVPLVTEAFDWEHGVFLGSIMSSEKTAAAGRRRRRGALRPLRHAAVLRLQHGRLLRPLARDRRGHRRRQAARSSSGSTGSARATTARSSGPASARTAGCSSGSSSGSRAPATPSTRRSAGCRPPTRSTPTASTSTADVLERAPHGRRRGAGAQEIPLIEEHYAVDRRAPPPGAARRARGPREAPRRLSRSGQPSPSVSPGGPGAAGGRRARQRPASSVELEGRRTRGRAGRPGSLAAEVEEHRLDQQVDELAPDPSR